MTLQKYFQKILHQRAEWDIQDGTHGGRVDINSTSLTFGRVTHYTYGIIENYLSLKAEFGKGKEVRFPQTDTEIAAMVIDGNKR